MFIKLVAFEFFENFFDFGRGDFRHIGDALLFDFEKNLVIEFFWDIGRFFALYLIEPSQSPECRPFIPLYGSARIDNLPYKPWFPTGPDYTLDRLPRDCYSNARNLPTNI